jgi:small subunit ribosomal protein S7
MPRRKAAVKREVLPDPLYGSDRLAKFINVIMRRGKKSLAENIVYEALTEVSKRLKKTDKHHSSKKDEDSGEGEGGRSGGGSNTVKLKPAQGREGLDVLDKALNNVRPTVEVKSRRVGGATYQVPIEVSVDRGLALAMRWVVKAAKVRSEKTMVLRLAAEVLDAHEGRGTAVKIRDDMHRMAKANQAFAHYRW